MPTRRRFLARLGGSAAAAGVMTAVPTKWNTAMAAARDLSRTPGSPEEIARDEEFWLEIQKAFTTDRSLVNLNNGGVSPTPAHVLEAMKRDLDFANQIPVYNGWQILEPQREASAPGSPASGMWTPRRSRSRATRRRVSRSSRTDTTSSAATKS